MITSYGAAFILFSGGIMLQFQARLAFEKEQYNRLEGMMKKKQGRDIRLQADQAVKGNDQ